MLRGMLSTMNQGRPSDVPCTSVQALQMRRPRPLRRERGGSTGATATGSTGTTTAAARTESTGQQLPWKRDGAGHIALCTDASRYACGQQVASNGSDASHSILSVSTMGQGPKHLSRVHLEFSSLMYTLRSCQVL